MSVWLNLSRRGRIVLACVAGLLLLACAAFFFDTQLSTSAMGMRSVAENETTRLGEFLQLVRVFGLADTLLLLGLLLGLAGNRQFLLRLALSLLVVAALVNPAKVLVGRERPDNSDYRSFPSGDTATAFVLPLVAGGNPLLATGGALVATSVAGSRVFFAKHYPLDVLCGAAAGLMAGLVGCWFYRRRRKFAAALERRLQPLPASTATGAEEDVEQAITGWRRLLTRLLARVAAPVLRWNPPQEFFLWATVVFLAGEVINAAVDGHHRHIVQFLAWYGPALILYIVHVRLRPRYGRKRVGWPTELQKGNLHLLIRRAVTFSGILGGLLMTLPWVLNAPGARAPAFSAGLLLVVFCWLAGKGLRTGRLGAVVADSVTMFYLVQIYVLGYLLHVL